MRYGYCTGFSTNPHFKVGLDLLDMIRTAGFGYVEFPLMNFYGMPEAEFAEIEKEVSSHGLGCPVACNFFPGNVRLVGKELDRDLISTYLDAVIPRLQRLGIKTLILGSGPARTFGPEQTREEAFNQFSSVLKDTILPKTKKAGMLVCIEPFERTYCNLIVSVTEGIELVEKVGDSGLELMVDLYHMLSNGEPLEQIRDCFAHIKHIHVAGPDRRVPEDNDTYIFKALDLFRELGYDGTLSFETEMPRSCEHLAGVLSKIRKHIEG